MKDVSQSLPDSLDDAARRFSEFLENNGYPGNVHWVNSADVAVDRQGKYWVRNRSTSGLRQAMMRYRSGVQLGLGAALRAVCANEKTTFASIFIPCDKADAEYAMMGNGLKLSCPTTKHPTVVVSNSLRWLVLRAQHRKRTNVLEL
jgi:hypothetical protein